MQASSVVAQTCQRISNFPSDAVPGSLEIAGQLSMVTRFACELYLLGLQRLDHRVVQGIVRPAYRCSTFSFDLRSLKRLGDS
jgi:hypothetical protein